MNGFDLARSLNKLSGVMQAYASLNEAVAAPARPVGRTTPPPLPQQQGRTTPPPLPQQQGRTTPPPLPQQGSKTPPPLPQAQGTQPARPQGQPQPAQGQQAQQAQARPAQAGGKVIAGIQIGPDGIAQLPNTMVGTPQQREQAVQKRMAYAEAMGKRYPDGIAPITKFDWSSDDKLIYGPLINASWERIKGKFTPQQGKDIMGKFNLNRQRWSAWKIKTPRELWDKLADWNRRNIIGRRAEIQQRDPKWGMAQPVVWTNDPFAGS